MNTVSVRTLFALFSDEEDTERYAPVIELALRETELMLVTGADRSDVRLDFLCAALANYRLQQIKSGQDRRNTPTPERSSTAAPAAALTVRKDC